MNPLLFIPTVYAAIFFAIVYPTPAANRTPPSNFGVILSFVWLLTMAVYAVAYFIGIVQRPAYSAT